MKRGLVFLAAFAGAIIGALVTLFAARWVASQSGPGYDSFETHQNSWFADAAKLSGKAAPTGLNFVGAANSVRASVVHIKTTYKPTLLNRYDGRDAIEDFFGDRYHEKQDMMPREASGSGVIISDDGYIVTNNHVISEASDITVILNDKRRYKGKLIGADPTTDLALVKIEGTSLPFAPYGNSDSLQIGEWVLAVGNPFELTSTVTAGIVSAKARNINILGGARGNGMAVESFIQTDAAVNPGNSGGALVDLQGRLIGINTAIASNTGTFSGYSFAVPVTLVKKVMDDLLRYGEVQRAMLGINILDVSADLAEAKGIPDMRGVYVAGVGATSSAGKAGLKSGDVILEINKVPINSTSALQEYVARFRPGDKVDLTYERGKAIQSVQVVLRNSDGLDKIAKAGPRPTVYVRSLGVKMRTIGSEEKSQLGLENGVEIVALEEESAFAGAGVHEGFIITSIDKRPMAKPDDVVRMTAGAKGGLLIEGFYPDGRRAYYAIGF